MVLPKIVLVELVGRREPAGEKAATERAVRDEADAELADRRQHLGFRVARPQRPLGLQRGDRVDGVRAPDGPRPSLREANVLHLPLGHQLRHRSDRLLDRRARVDTVLVVEVDMLDP